MRTSLKRQIDSHTGPVWRLTEEHAKRMSEVMHTSSKREHGFAGLKIFGWTFYGGMWK